MTHLIVGIRHSFANVSNHDGDYDDDDDDVSYVIKIIIIIILSSVVLFIIS